MESSIELSSRNLIHYLWNLPTAEAYVLIRLRFSLLNRVTRAGRAYDEAMEHLYNLKLRENVEASGAKRLGDAIRSHLRNLYQIGDLTSDGANVIDASSDEQSIMET